MEHEKQVPAAEVRAQALEEAAKLCDEMEQHYSDYKDTALLNGEVDLSNAASGEPRACRFLAERIRALAQSSTADKASEVRAAAEHLKPLASLHDELNRITWEGEDEGWNLAIKAVQKRISEIVKAGLAAPSTADSGNTGALGEGADQ